MMKFLSRSSKRRGSTLLEAVIAIAVITIVTATAITIIEKSITVNKNSRQREDALSVVDDAVECFRFGDTLDEFEEALSHSSHEFVADPDPENAGTFTVTTDTYVVTVTVDYGGSDNNGRPQFSAVANTPEGEEIYSVDFSKGGIADVNDASPEE